MALTAPALMALKEADLYDIFSGLGDADALSCASLGSAYSAPDVSVRDSWEAQDLGGFDGV